MKKVVFPDDGVEFIFPESLKHIVVNKKPKHDDCPDDEIFKPKGYVITFDFGLYDPDKGEYIKDFRLDDGYELTVRYHTGHLISAGGHNKIKLGLYYDNKWYTKEPYEHNTEKDGKWRGYFRVILKSLTDPVVGWGP